MSYIIGQDLLNLIVKTEYNYETLSFADKKNIHANKAVYL